MHSRKGAQSKTSEWQESGGGVESEVRTQKNKLFCLLLHLLHHSGKWLKGAFRLWGTTKWQWRAESHPHSPVIHSLSQNLRPAVHIWGNKEFPQIILFDNVTSGSKELCILVSAGSRRCWWWSAAWPAWFAPSWSELPAFGSVQEQAAPAVHRQPASSLGHSATKQSSNYFSAQNHAQLRKQF